MKQFPSLWTGCASSNSNVPVTMPVPQNVIGFEDRIFMGMMAKISQHLARAGEGWGII